MFVEQPGKLPAPPAEGRVAVVDVAFAAGENFEKSTLPFLDALGDRLAIWIDHHEHPLGWSRFRGDPRFLLVPNRIAPVATQSPAFSPERIATWLRFMLP